MVTSEELKSIRDAISSRTKGLTELRTKLSKYNDGKGYSRQYIYLVLKGERYNTYVINEAVKLVSGFVKDRHNITSVVEQFNSAREALAV